MVADDEKDQATHEYDKAAERYNEIYKAVWQNFSYMAVLAGAILTFGGARLGAVYASLIACAPLLVWYWATFEPLNRYGDLVEKRLRALESALRFRLYTDLYMDRYDSLDSPPPVRGRCLLAVAVFCLVVALAGFRYQAIMKPPASWAPVALGLAAALPLAYLAWRFGRRELTVRRGIRLLAIILHLFFAFLLGASIADLQANIPQQGAPTTIGTTVAGPPLSSADSQSSPRPGSTPVPQAADHQAHSPAKVVK
jgi:hypothetical protein